MKCFFDTNVLLYQYDASESRKQHVADKLVKRTVERGEFLISTQVMMEFYHVASRKYARAFSARRLQELLLQFAATDPIAMTPGLVVEALSIHLQHSISWWDATIVAAALHADADVLYSEDLQHGRLFDNLRIENPFLPAVHESPAPYRVRRKK